MLKKHVRVTQLANELSDGDDRAFKPAGDKGAGSVRDYVAPGELQEREDEEILDWFHSNCPIGCLDDFDISVVETDSGPTRKEHLDWCKQRALAEIEAGRMDAAIASFLSDVSKHAETRNVAATFEQLGFPLLLMGQLSSPEELREHILGYN